MEAKLFNIQLAEQDDEIVSMVIQNVSEVTAIIETGSLILEESCCVEKESSLIDISLEVTEALTGQTEVTNNVDPPSIDALTSHMNEIDTLDSVAESLKSGI